MAKVCVMLAEGFEEIEAITVVDLLKRAGVHVELISTTGKMDVKGAHNITITADSLFVEGSYREYDLMFLPGGMPGTSNLDSTEELKSEIRRFVKGQKYLTAICAAPMVYGEMGILEGVHATCYPGFEGHLKGAIYENAAVVCDGKFVTGRGPAAAVEMGLTLIKILVGEDAAREVADGIIKE